MSKKLSSSLGLDLPALAELIRAKGRGKDTVLAHITPKEAALLKRRGGRGSTNPDTGLLEFDDTYDFGPTYSELGYTPSADQAAQTPVSMDQFLSAGYQAPPTDQPVAPTQDQVATPAPTQDQSAATGISANVPLFPQGYDPSTAGLTPSEMTLGSFATPGPYAFVQPGTPGISPTGAYTPSPLGAQLQTQGADADTRTTQDALSAISEDGTTPKKKEESYLDKLLSGDTLAKLGIAGLLGGGLAKGVAQPAARQATQQAQQAAQQYQALAQPYRATAQNLISSAQTGALTPSNLQAVNTARQIAAQNIKSRGGVGVEQAANQTAQLEANLLEKQFSTGLQLAGIADQFDAQAIQTALSANQGVVASNAAFYTQLANMLAPFVFGTGQMTSPTQVAARPTTTTGAI